MRWVLRSFLPHGGSERSTGFMGGTSREYFQNRPPKNRTMTVQNQVIERSALVSTTPHRKRRTKGSIPANTKDLLSRCKKAGMTITLGGSGHHRVWLSGTPHRGASVTVSATASDCRSLLNSIMLIRSLSGIDLRTL